MNVRISVRVLSVLSLALKCKKNQYTIWTALVLPFLF